MPTPPGDDPKFNVTLPDSLTKDVVNQLLKKGWTKTEIAQAYGTTRQAVQWHYNQLQNPYRDPRKVALDALPWKDMPHSHKRARPHVLIADHLEYVHTKGKDMSEDRLRRLSRFYEKLLDRGIVIAYDPEQPPTLNNKFGGWLEIPREERDEDLVIRIDGHTQIPEKDRDLWRIPKKRPKASGR